MYPTFPTIPDAIKRAKNLLLQGAFGDPVALLSGRAAIRQEDGEELATPSLGFAGGISNLPHLRTEAKFQVDAFHKAYLEAKRHSEKVDPASPTYIAQRPRHLLKARHTPSGKFVSG